MKIAASVWQFRKMLSEGMLADWIGTTRMLSVPSGRRNFSTYLPLEYVFASEAAI